MACEELHARFITCEKAAGRVTLETQHTQHLTARLQRDRELTLRVGQTRQRNLTGEPARIADSRQLLAHGTQVLGKRLGSKARVHLSRHALQLQPPGGEGLGVRIQGPRGEHGFYIVSDGTNRPMRVKARAPSFLGCQALPKMIEGGLIADVIAVIGSTDVVMGDVDR